MPRKVEHHYGSYIVNGQLVQCDYDYPTAVASLGYGLRRRGEKCKHSQTDGTIDCPECHKTSSQFIQESSEILDRLAY
jgi:hypothetical protein